MNPVRPAWEQGGKASGLSTYFTGRKWRHRTFSSSLLSPSSAPGTGTGEDGDPGRDGGPFPKRHGFIVEAGGSPHGVTGAGLDGGPPAHLGAEEVVPGPVDPGWVL